MLLLYFVLAVITFCLLLIHWFQTRSHTAKFLNAFPEPQAPPITGYLITLSTKPDVLFQQIRTLCASYTESFRLWAVHFPTLHVVRADDAEIILSNMKHLDKGYIYDTIIPWLRSGLLTSKAGKWQHRRKILTPAFHFNILRRFVTVFGEANDKLIQQLREECKKQKTDIIPFLTEHTLAVICETAMGTKLNMEDKSHGNYLKAIHSVGEICIKRFVNPWYYYNILFKLSPLGRKFNNKLKILHNFTASVIKEREKNFKDDDVEDLDKTDDVYKSKRCLAMLDLMISAKNHRNEIDEEGIREEVDTFMFEGHDTTSVALTYILLTLANHPNVQKIIVELDEIFGTSKRHATYEDLQMMKYTEMCIKECLRLYPSVYFISRLIQEDTKLTQHTVPAGTEVYIHIYNVHRDPKYYPDPENFDPDRFLPENSKGRHPYTYIPFSAGPRNCIGQKFAMLELKSIVSSVLRNFKMTAVDTAADLKWVTDVVLRAKGPINVKFVLRDF